MYCLTFNDGGPDLALYGLLSEHPSFYYLMFQLSFEIGRHGNAYGNISVHVSPN